MNVAAVAIRHSRAIVLVAVALVIAGADKKAHRRKVEVGLTTSTMVELVSGVTAGEQVIVQGQNGLPDAADIVISS